jgi:tetratricopeptide (TPR) repeat protein
MNYAPPPVDTVETLYAAGFYLCERSRYADALRIFRALVLRAPMDERAWLALGHCKEKLDDPLTAIRLYAMGAVAVPAAARCCAAAGRLLRESGDCDAAEAAFERAEAIAEASADPELTQHIRRMRGS